MFLFYKFKMKLFFLFFLLIFIVLPVNNNGQFFIKDSSNFSRSDFRQNKLSNNFLKQLNTYSLNTNLIYSINAGNYFVGIKENYISTINKSTYTNIKDENNLLLYGDYRISQLIQPGILLKHAIYSDDRKIDINQASLTNLIVFSKIMPTNKIQLTPYVGYSNNYQLSEKDNGVIYGIDGNINKINLNDIELNFNGKFENEKIDPRENNLRIANLELNNEISEGLFNSFAGYYSQQNKDFYFEPDSATESFFNISNNIQTRKEINYYIQERMNYYFPNSNINFDLGGRITWRDIDKHTRYILVQNLAGNLDSEIKEFKLDLFSSFDIRLDEFLVNLKMNYSEQEEKHFSKRIEGIGDYFFQERNELEKLLNNKAKQTTLTLNGIYNLSPKDFISISLFHRKLVYDTPSEENFDDRDELLTMAKVNYLRKLTPFFNAFINLEININKIVYIFAERSANNNIKRIFKFSAGGMYDVKRLISTNSAEVSSNYIVYDFEELNPNYKSYSFRQFVFRDSTIIKISSLIDFFTSGHLKLSEQGEFNWKDFSGKPLRYLVEVYAEPLFYYKIKNTKFGIGFRYFELSTYNVINGKNKNLDTRYRSIAPLSQIITDINNRLYLEINCRYEFIRNEKNKLTNQTYFYLDLHWKF